MLLLFICLILVENVYNVVESIDTDNIYYVERMVKCYLVYLTPKHVVSAL